MAKPEDNSAEIESLRAELAKAKTERDAAQDERDALKAKAVTPMPFAKPAATDLDEYKDGEFKQVSNGELFKLKIVKDDELGRTHKLKNVEHFKELSEADFRAQFDKK